MGASASLSGGLWAPAHEDLHARINEVEKMLGAFHRKLTANG